MKPGGEMRIDKRKNPLNFRPDPAYVLLKCKTGHWHWLWERIPSPNLSQYISLYTVYPLIVIRQVFQTTDLSQTSFPDSFSSSFWLEY